MYIVPLLLDAIKDEITLKCITEMIPGPSGEDNPFALTSVKIGRFFDDPNKSQFRAAVLHGDLEDSSYPDGIFKRATHQRSIAMNYPSREIGGGEIWLRRGTIRFELYFLGVKDSTEAEIRYRAYSMADNIFNAVKNMSVAGIHSDNEKASEIFVVASEILQTGGPPSSWIYRGKFYWEVQTEIKPVQ